ncbi:MAG: NAD-dependent epimerase/dehydratase family protein [Candidatus Latescibacteria bacterium]|nr:NAD-dependent epimerase/dehydratase family protein [Candidatus Latescibacterota bacterium]
MIVVTGAAGRLGGRVVQCLVERGYEVLGTDRVPCPESPAPFVQADLCDVGQVDRLMAGAQALIHMGAIPGPTPGSPHEVLQNNTLSTFNVLWAAAQRKLRRVVFSSSAFGMAFAHDPRAFVPLYLPLDEEHPMMPFEPYGLTKQLGECIGEMVARSAATSVASLRFTNVVSPQGQAEFPLPAPTPEAPTTLVMWAYADPRDVAVAHVLALEADLQGHEAFMLAQPTTRFAEPTRELIRRNFGAQIEIRGPLEGNASVLDTSKAQRLLGWQPRPGWGQGEEGGG